MLRKSKFEDIGRIMEIIRQAQTYLKSQGVDQWQNGYPDETAIESDIKNNISYVLEEEGEILATSAISFEGEPTYNKIYEGKWIGADEFAVIHRIAVANNCKGHGLAGRLIKETANLCSKRNVKSIRIDTHTENLAMKNCIKKNGFEYCGIITISDGSQRVAFEKIIE